MSNEPKRNFTADLESIAKDEMDGIPVAECARNALVSLAVQKRLLDHLRGILFAEAAWLLREVESDGIDERERDKLKACALRLSDAARTVVGKRDEQPKDSTVESPSVEKKTDKTAESLNWD